MGAGREVSVVRHGHDDRSAVGIGFEWSARLTTLGFEVAIPALAGAWLDRRWGTGPWLLIAGALVGMCIAGLHLFQIVQALDDPKSGATGGDG